MPPPKLAIVIKDEDSAVLPLANNPVLLRSFGGTLERVPFSPLNSKCSYILLDPSNAYLFIWLGVRSSMRDRNHADKSASIILQRDLPQWTLHPVIRESMVARNPVPPEVALFMNVLKEANVDPTVSNDNEPDTGLQILYSVSSTARDAVPMQVAESTDSAPTMYSTLTSQPPANCFIVQTLHELFIYPGPSCLEDLKQAAVTYAEDHLLKPSGFLTVVERDSEPTVFKQRFRNWPMSADSMSPRSGALGPRKQRSPMARARSPTNGNGSASPLNRRWSYRRRPSNAANTPAELTMRLAQRQGVVSRGLMSRGTTTTTWRPKKQGRGVAVVNKAADNWFDDDGAYDVLEPLIPLSSKGLQAEVQRSMLRATEGTTALLGAGCGDPSAPELEMKSALSGKGLVRQWHVEVAGTENKLHLVEVRTARLGVLTSGDAYFVTCNKAYVVVTDEPQPGGGLAVKSEVRVDTVVYLWLGKNYPDKEILRLKIKQDEKGLLIRELLEAGDVSEQHVTKVIVEQGREPPYLLGLFGAKGLGIIILDGISNRGRRRAARARAATPTRHPRMSPTPPSRLTVSPPASPAGSVNGSTSGDISGLTTRVFEVAEVPRFPYLQSRCVICVEVGLDLIAKGLQPHKSYVVMKSPCQRTKSYSQMWLWHGSMETPVIEQFLNHIVRNSRILFIQGKRQRIPPSLMRGYISHIKPSMPVPDGFWVALGLDNSKIAETMDIPTFRAVRLWQVDYESAKEDALKVSIGSSSDSAHWRPFIREVGPLCVFTQADLIPTSSYVLDAGCDTIFVWHGARASQKARELAVRCGKIFTASTQMGVELSSVQVPLLVQVESGHEISEFLGCFRGWVPKQQEASTSIVSIDPYELDEEDYSDVKGAESALLRNVKVNKGVVSKPAAAPITAPAPVHAVSPLNVPPAIGVRSISSNSSNDGWGVKLGVGITELKSPPPHPGHAAPRPPLAHDSPRQSKGLGSGSSASGGSSRQLSPTQMLSSPSPPPPAVGTPLTALASATTAATTTATTTAAAAALSRVLTVAVTCKGVTSEGPDNVTYRVRVKDVTRRRNDSDSSLAPRVENEDPSSPAAADEWEVTRSLVDFRGLHVLIETDCQGMANTFPSQREIVLLQSGAGAEDSTSGGSEVAENWSNVVANRVTLWLEELLSASKQPPITLRGRFRVHAFLAAQKLDGLAALVLDHMSGQAKAGKADLSYQTYAKNLPVSGIFQPLRAGLEAVGHVVAAEQAALKYKLQEAEKRAMFAQALQDEERRKAGLLRKEVDNLFKKRRALRNEMYAELQSKGGSPSISPNMKSESAHPRERRSSLPHSASNSHLVGAAGGGGATDSSRTARGAERRGALYGRKTAKSASPLPSRGEAADGGRGVDNSSTHGSGRSTPGEPASPSVESGSGGGQWRKVFKGMFSSGSSNSLSAQTPPSSTARRASTTPAAYDDRRAADGAPFTAVIQNLSSKKAELAGVEQAYTAMSKRRQEHLQRADKSQATLVEVDNLMATLVATLANLVTRSDAFVDEFMLKLPKLERGGGAYQELILSPKSAKTWWDKKT